MKASGKFLELICQYVLWLSRPQVSSREACHHQRQIAKGRAKTEDDADT